MAIFDVVLSYRKLSRELQQKIRELLQTRSGKKIYFCCRKNRREFPQTGGEFPQTGRELTQK